MGLLYNLICTQDIAAHNFAITLPFQAPGVYLAMALPSRTRKPKPTGQKRTRGGGFHFERAVGTIHTAESGMAVPASLIIEDLNPKSVTLFASGSVPVGEQCSVVIDGYYQITVQGVIRACNLVNSDSKILSSIKYDHRVLIRLSVRTLDEQETIEKFCKEARDGFHPSEDEEGI